MNKLSMYDAAIGMAMGMAPATGVYRLPKGRTELLAIYGDKPPKTGKPKSVRRKAKLQKLARRKNRSK